MKRTKKLSAAHKKAISRGVKAYHSRCKRINLNKQVASVKLNINKKRKKDERIAEILKRFRERKSKKLKII